MHKLLILALFASSLPAFAEVDRLPTKEEMVESFTESFNSKREKAKEYYAGDQARIDATIKMNTVSKEDIERTAQFTVDALKKQVEICNALQAKNPKTKGVSCITGVLMVSGLGHADQQKMIMDMLADRAASADLKKNLGAIGEQEKYALEAIKKGINPKSKDLDRDQQSVMSSLGMISQFTWLRQQVNRAPAPAAEAAPAAHSAE